MDMRWNLDRLYTSFDSMEYKQDYEAFSQAVVDMCEWAEANLKEPSDPVEKLESFIIKENAISRFYNLHEYTSLILSVDSTNDRAMKYMDALSALTAELSGPEALFKQFAGSVEKLDEVIDSSALLREHAFILREAAAESCHMLSQSEEAIIAKLRITGSDAWETMKDQLVSTLMITVALPDGDKTMPLSMVRNLAHDGDVRVRKAAYEAELAAYQRVDKASAFALNSIKGEVLTITTLRGYESPLDMTLKQSRMERGTLDAMLGAIRDALPDLRRFYRHKAEMLGHGNGLPFYDLFAPVGSVDMRFTYDESAAYIVKCFSRFSDKLGAFAQKAFDESWIDAEPREGKRGGAFCSNIHSIGESRVLSNFSGSFNDVVTLAHELGHGYHGDCLNDASFLNSDYTMPIAETASTFCETIVTNAALETAAPEGRMAILENQITDMTQVIVDIYSRYLFESALFEKRPEGPLSVQELNVLMLDAQKQAYGDGLDFSFPHPYMWVNKVHYYYAGRNFYNFPYAYGLLFALGLYAEYKRSGDAFIGKYDALLAATGRNSLEDIGRMAGIDVGSRAFWESSLNVVRERVNEFCSMGI